MPAALLNVDNVACSRGESVLFEGLNFTLNAGKCLHIIGPNGCGKSTLLRMLCTITSPDQGQITWVEHANFTYLGHKDALKNELTAIENLRFYQQLSARHNEQELDNCLYKMGILHRADVSAQNLSFGQRRRLGFARLLIQPANVWVLDEPFTGIDQAGRQLIERCCVDHLEQGNALILTHHQSLDSSLLKPYRQELVLGAAI